MDLKQIKSLFSSTDYTRGMEYYRQGRVLDMECTENGRDMRVTCRVCGTFDYDVGFQETSDGHIYIACTCPRFDDVHRCKHLAAAMIAYAEQPPVAVGAGSDRYARELLQRYLKNHRRRLNRPASLST